MDLSILLHYDTASRGRHLLHYIGFCGIFQHTAPVTTARDAPVFSPTLFAWKVRFFVWLTFFWGQTDKGFVCPACIWWKTDTLFRRFVGSKGKSRLIYVCPRLKLRQTDKNCLDDGEKYMDRRGIGRLA